MADTQTGGNAGGESAPWSAREAAMALTEEQTAPPEKAPVKEPVSQPPSAPEAPAADEPQTGSPDGETTDEGQEQASDSDLPTIEPPTSWTKDAQERWAKLDRETQDYLVARDREDNAAVKRKFQEAEEQLKGLTAREQAMEQQRLQMEAITIAKAQALQKVLQRDFSDIQNFEDVKKLAAEDWARYNQWQVFQHELAAETAEAQAAQQRQANEAQAKFARFAEEQDKKFIERAPDFADKDKAAKLKEGAIAALKDAGFSADELTKHWSGQAEISMRDHRVQLLFADAARYRQAQESAKKTVANKSLPPVQRPGVAQQSTSLQSQIAALEKQSRRSTGAAQLKIEAQIMDLEQKARARR